MKKGQVKKLVGNKYFAMPAGMARTAYRFLAFLKRQSMPFFDR